MSHLRLSLFAGFDATLDGQPITAFGTDKARALLAYLAVAAPRAQRRSDLAALLWPEATDAQAAHNLSQTLLRLRRALGEAQAPAQPSGGGGFDLLERSFWERPPGDGYAAWLHAAGED